MKQEGFRYVLPLHIILFLLLLVVFPGSVFSNESGFISGKPVIQLSLPPGQIPGGVRIKPDKGRFLVATSRLDNSFFAKTVILLIDYGLQGATGLIINMPGSVEASRLFPDVDWLTGKKDTVYIGGPVSINHFHILFSASEKPDESLHVFEDIYFSMSRNILDNLGHGSVGDRHFRIYAGYAGWGPGQLEAEIMKGAWQVVKGERDVIFEADVSGIWKRFYRGRPESPVRIIWLVPDLVSPTEVTRMAALSWTGHLFSHMPHPTHNSGSR